MPVGLSGDRKLLIVLAVLLPVFIGLTLLLAPDEDLANADVSTYSARSGGAKATFELIQELGFRVERWQQPIARLNGAEGWLLIVARPRRFLRKSEGDALKQFVDAGGSVLITGRISSDLIPPDRYDFAEATQAWHAYPAGPPQAMNRGVVAIHMPEQLSWNVQADDVPLFGEGKRAVAVTFTHGKGRVIWLASHIPLCNAGLKGGGNAEFLGNVLQVIHPGVVYWYGDTAQAADSKSVFRSPPVLAIFAQVLFVFGLVLWTYARRYGPVHAPVENTAPLAQLEFVHTLGSLYGTANATNIAVEIAYRRFVFLTSRHFGVPQDELLRERLSTAVARALYLPETEVADFFARCEAAAHTPKLPRDEAKEITNKLREYLVNLKLISTQEKH